MLDTKLIIFDFFFFFFLKKNSETNLKNDY